MEQNYAFKSTREIFFKNDPIRRMIELTKKQAHRRYEASGIKSYFPFSSAPLTFYLDNHENPDSLNDVVHRMIIDRLNEALIFY